MHLLKARSLFHQSLIILLFLYFQPHASAQSFPNLRKDAEIYNRSITIERMQMIEKALESYARAFERIPCPSLSNLAITNANFGHEAVINFNSITGLNDRDCDSDQSYTGTNLVAGSIPVRTLGLKDELMFDGWGRKILYVIDQDFANKGDKMIDLGGNESSYLSSRKGEMEVYDTTLGGTLLNDATHLTMALLISSGVNGHAAYTRSGNQIDSISPGVDEFENSHYNGGATGSVDHIFVQQEFSNTFDDIVYLIERSGGLGTAAANPNAVPLYCPGYGTTAITNGSTPAGSNYPAYDWPNVLPGNTEMKSCTMGAGAVSRDCDTDATWDTTAPDPESTC